MPDKHEADNNDMTVTIRDMFPEDIADGERLCRIAGWNQLQEDWELFVHGENSCGFVAINRGDVCGTATIINYNNLFGWIGMVLVDPERRRMGIGTKLLDACIKGLEKQGCGAIKLDATPMGKKVYDKLGFEDEYMLSRMVCDSTDVPDVDISSIRPMESSDVEQMSSLEEQAFGVERKELLQHLKSNSPEYAKVYSDENGNISGFVLGRHGKNREHIGPVFAESFDIAKSLVSSVLSEIKGKPALMDITIKDNRWREWLESLGFSEERPFIRMFKGCNVDVARPETCFAIAGPELG